MSKHSKITSAAIAAVFGIASAAGAFAQTRHLDEKDPSRVCVPTHDTDAMPEKLPEIEADLQKLKMLPVTGAPFVERISKEQDTILVCMIDPVQGSLEAAHTDEKRVLIVRGYGSHITYHDLFHGKQYKTKAFQDAISSLDIRDAAFALILMEATGIAYEMAVEKEASLDGVTFARERRGDFPAANPNNKAVFDQAYNKSLAANSTLQSKERRTKALEAGGQAIVNHLVGMGDPGWVASYRPNIAGIINEHQFRDGLRESAGYAQKRQEIFERIGAGLDDIHFVPRGNPSPKAGDFVDSILAQWGFISEPQAATPAQVPSSDRKRPAP